MYCKMHLSGFVASIKMMHQRNVKSSAQVLLYLGYSVFHNLPLIGAARIISVTKGLNTFH